MPKSKRKPGVSRKVIYTIGDHTMVLNQAAMARRREAVAKAHSYLRQGLVEEAKRIFNEGYIPHAGPVDPTPGNLNRREEGKHQGPRKEVKRGEAEVEGENGDRGKEENTRISMSKAPEEMIHYDEGERCREGVVLPSTDKVVSTLRE